MKAEIIKNVRKDAKNTESENNLNHRKDKIPISGRIFIFIVFLSAAIGGFVCFLVTRFIGDVFGRL